VLAERHEHREAIVRAERACPVSRVWSRRLADIATAVVAALAVARIEVRSERSRAPTVCDHLRLDRSRREASTAPSVRLQPFQLRSCLSCQLVEPFVQCNIDLQQVLTVEPLVSELLADGTPRMLGTVVGLAMR
jgi:hypothetical protein